MLHVHFRRIHSPRCVCDVRKCHIVGQLSNDLHRLRSVCRSFQSIIEDSDLPYAFLQVNKESSTKLLESNVVARKALKVFGLKIDLSAMTPADIRRWLPLFNTFLNVRRIEVIGDFARGDPEGAEERRALVVAVENMIVWGGSLANSIYCELPIDLFSTLRTNSKGRTRSCLLNTMSKGR